MYKPEEVKDIKVYDIFPCPELKIETDPDLYVLKPNAKIHQPYVTFTYAHMVYMYNANDDINYECIDELIHMIKNNKVCDMHDSEAAGLLLTLWLNDSRDMIWTLYKLTLRSKVNQRIDWLKHVHTYVRLTSQVPIFGYLEREDAMQMQYLNNIPNRREFKKASELKDDIMKRQNFSFPKGFIYTDGKKIKKDPTKYEAMFKKQLKKFYSTKLKSTDIDRVQTWDEYFDQRTVLVPDGACSGASVNGIRVGKRAANESGYVEREILEKAKPCLISTQSLKYENGKIRSLYGSDVVSFMVENYLSVTTEKAMFRTEEIAYGKSMFEVFKNELKLNKSQLRGRGIMWDYADFNSQHVHKLMQMRWQVIKELFIDVKQNKDHDFVKACDWMTEAEINSWIISADDSIGMRTGRGLTTGRKGTQEINSVMNYLYMQGVIENYNSIVSDKQLEFSIWRVCGDDVFAAVDNVLDTIIIALLMNCQGFEGQFTKLTPIGEFLRVRYDGEKIGGYLTRSIANVITRDHNRSELKDPITKLGALIVHMRKLVSRGANHRNATMFIKHAKKFVTRVHNGKDKFIEVPCGWTLSNVIYGGRGIADLTHKLYNIEIPANRLEAMSASDYVDVAKLPVEMSKDYAKYINETMLIEIDEKEVVDTMKRSNYISMVKDSEIKKLRQAQYDEINRMAKGMKIKEELYKNTTMYVNYAEQIYQEFVSMIVKPGVLDSYKSNILLNVGDIIMKTGIKRKDILMMLIRNYCKKNNTSEIVALIKIFGMQGVEVKVYGDLMQTLTVLGVEMFIDVMYNNVKINNYLEGWVRDSVLTVIRMLIITAYVKYVKTNIKVGLVEFITDCEYYITRKIIAFNLNFCGQ